MSELLLTDEDDPGPLSGLKNGLHYYHIGQFLSEIVPEDSPLTIHYRDEYSRGDDVAEERTTMSSHDAVEQISSRHRTALMGYFARIGAVFS